MDQIKAFGMSLEDNTTTTFIVLFRQFISIMLDNYYISSMLTVHFIFSELSVVQSSG
jgi:hypothetical protein